MALQINQYSKTRTDLTIQDDDLLDFDSTEDSGTSYESAKITVSDFLAYVSANVSSNSIYTADDTILADRTLTASGAYTKWNDGDTKIDHTGESDSYGFIIEFSSSERGQLGFNQLLQSAFLELQNFDIGPGLGTFFNAIDGKVAVGHGTATSTLHVKGSGSTVATTNFLAQNSVGSDLMTILDNGFVGVGTSTAIGTEKFRVLTQNFAFNGTDEAVKFSNNLGDWIAINSGGGIDINNFNTGLGADLGTQNLNTYFVDYNFSSIRNSPNPSGTSYLSFDANLGNSSPFTRMGINTVNTSLDTLLQINLDKGGADIAISPIVIDILDNYGVHDVDLAGATEIKTGIKSSLIGSFTTTTTGNGIVRAGWFNAEGGDENQAIFIDNGLIMSPNMPTSSAGLPTGAMWNNSGVVNIV